MMQSLESYTGSQPVFLAYYSDISDIIINLFPLLPWYVGLVFLTRHVGLVFQTVRSGTSSPDSAFSQGVLDAVQSTSTSVFLSSSSQAHPPPSFFYPHIPLPTFVLPAYSSLSYSFQLCDSMTHPHPQLVTPWHIHNLWLHDTSTSATCDSMTHPRPQLVTPWHIHIRNLWLHDTSTSAPFTWHIQLCTT